MQIVGSSLTPLNTVPIYRGTNMQYHQIIIFFYPSPNIATVNKKINTYEGIILARDVSEILVMFLGKVATFWRQTASDKMEAACTNQTCKCNNRVMFR